MNTELEALRSRNPGVEILPRGTGDALPDGPKGILKKRNKWFVAHPENTAKVAAGDYPRPAGCHARDQISDPSFCKPEVHCDPQCASGFFLCAEKLPQAKPVGFASSLKEGALGWCGLVSGTKKAPS